MKRALALGIALLCARPAIAEGVPDDAIRPPPAADVAAPLTRLIGADAAAVTLSVIGSLADGHRDIGQPRSTLSDVLIAGAGGVFLLSPAFAYGTTHQPGKAVVGFALRAALIVGTIALVSWAGDTECGAQQLKTSGDIGRCALAVFGPAIVGTAGSIGAPYVLLRF